MNNKNKKELTLEEFRLNEINSEKQCSSDVRIYSTAISYMSLQKVSSLIIINLIVIQLNEYVLSNFSYTYSVPRKRFTL